LRIGNLSRRRNLVGAIFRTFALEEIEVNGVRKVVDLLWLPDAEALAIVTDVEPVARRSDLLGKSEGVGGKIEASVARTPAPW